MGTSRERAGLSGGRLTVLLGIVAVGAAGGLALDRAHRVEQQTAQLAAEAAAGSAAIAAWRAERLADGARLATNTLGARYRAWQTDRDADGGRALRRELSAVAQAEGYALAVLQGPTDRVDLVATAPGVEADPRLDALAAHPHEGARVALSLLPSAPALEPLFVVDVALQVDGVGVGRARLLGALPEAPFQAPGRAVLTAGESPRRLSGPPGIEAATGAPIELEGRRWLTQIHRADGSPWVVVASSPVDALGYAWGPVGLGVLAGLALLGVTLRRRPRGEGERAGAMAQLTSVLDRLPDGVALVDMDGRYLYANPALCSLTGYTLGALEGRSVPDLVIERDGRRERVRRRDGTSLEVEVNTATIHIGAEQRVLRVARDITAWARAEAAVDDSEAMLLDAERIARMGHWSLDLTTGLFAWSDELHRIAGTEPAPITQAGFRALVVPSDWPMVDQQVNGLSRTGGRGEIEFRLRRPTDGAVRWIYWKADRLDAAPGQAPQIRGIAQDVTVRREREDRLRQSARVFECTRDAVVIMDRGGRIEAVNRAFTVITGYVEHEVRGERGLTLLADAEGGLAHDIEGAVIRSGGWQGEIENRNRSGALYPAILTVSSVQDEDGAPVHRIAVFSDITQLKAQQRHLEYLAHNDELTGLPNRHRFTTCGGQAIERARRTGRTGAVLFVDLDRFKHINDSLGHPMGDVVLKEVASRLAALSLSIARFGGDAFSVLLEDVDEAGALQVANTVIAAIEAPLVRESLDLALGASVGVALFPRDGTTIDALMSNADAAMYAAKVRSPGSVQVYTPELTAIARDRTTMVGRLRRAIEGDALFPVFQPQFDLKTGGLVGLEALVRWRTDDGELISPGRFIPLAEESGLIVPLGSWMLRTVCAQARAWIDQGYDFRRVAVNVAAPQVQREGFVDTVVTILRETGLPADRLELELTETAVMHEGARAIEAFVALREMGIDLAIDDFGTGYSSLANLIKLPFTKLKIDQQFVRTLPDDPTARTIVRSCIALGHNLGFTVIAEGVETEAQEAFLAEAGCDLTQGFLRARPDASPAVERFFTPPPGVAPPA